MQEKQYKFENSHRLLVGQGPIEPYCFGYFLWTLRNKHSLDLREKVWVFSESIHMNHNRSKVTKPSILPSLKQWSLSRGLFHVPSPCLSLVHTLSGHLTNHLFLSFLCYTVTSSCTWLWLLKPVAIWQLQ